MNHPLTEKILEEAKEIKNFPGYSITASYQIISKKTGKPMKVFIGRYKILKLVDATGRRRSCYIHKLIAQAFIPNPDNKLYVNHINGNKLDNGLEDLEWATKSEDAFHALETGLAKRYSGENIYASKLSEKQVRVIKHILKEKWYGITQKDIAKFFNATCSQINKINKSVTWKHVVI